ncbi:PBECR2 nuclease fold domain-containing protein [Actinobacillus equuli]|uniref:PBECR2 nuclease fold domain-containing protein n=1 Tax=Actinobacillus equuli TaxID=718 RepID=UPI0024466A2D|nr:PBECR2 nuclease fold domain-containing protein [Actinobacillus equuli]WGE83711.1 PBECR2 nuclease fold domain-containing protein [Actinobacillus equuli subsp. equuli]
MDNIIYGNVPFNEQIAFYRRKIPTPTATWTDIYNAEHDYAAVVAGANRREIIEDFAKSIQDFIENGKTLEDFRKDFDKIVAKHGWQYNGGRNWRSRIIYETNLRSSYQAGRYAQLQELKETMPYWEYVHSDAVTHPRVEHMHWDGLILRHDDPWWKTHFPINAWGCQCTVIARSQAYMDKLGLKPDNAPVIEWEEKLIGRRGLNPRLVKVPKGIDPGFEHIPGASRLNAHTLPPLDNNEQPRKVTFYPHRKDTPIPMPQPRTISHKLILPADKDDAFYINSFLSEFGATKENPVIFQDIIGEPLVISEALFTSRSGHTKVKKRGREVYLKILAQALKAPDEIWVRAEHHHHLNLLIVRRRYIARFKLDDGKQEVPALAVFDVGKDGWEGTTIFAPDNSEYLEQVRTGIMLYYRDEE